MKQFFTSTSTCALFIQNCRAALHQVGLMALANVCHDADGHPLCTAEGIPQGDGVPKGGPFSAQLALFFEDGGLELVGQPQSNNVMVSGLASAHAEHEVLSPALYKDLCERLHALKQENKVAILGLLSSGQSCTTCHTKQEIIARDLIKKGLLPAGHMINIFGATYDETLTIAQFNDKLYADALILASLHPQESDNIVTCVTSKLEDVPQIVQDILSKANKQTSIILRGDGLYAMGEDSRTPYDLFATAEIMALRQACLKHRTEGNLESWSIDGTLYTTTLSMGPLLFGEAGWTKINRIVHVQMPETLIAKQYETKETQDLTNRAFLCLIAEGYKSPQRALSVYHDETYDNQAQKSWAALIQHGTIPLYNGASETQATRAMRPETEKRFEAQSLSFYTRNEITPQGTGDK